MESGISLQHYLSNKFEVLSCSFGVLRASSLGEVSGKSLNAELKKIFLRHKLFNLKVNGPGRGATCWEIPCQ